MHDQTLSQVAVHAEVSVTLHPNIAIVNHMITTWPRLWFRPSEFAAAVAKQRTLALAAHRRMSGPWPAAAYGRWPLAHSEPRGSLANDDTAELRRALSFYFRFLGAVTATLLQLPATKHQATPRAVLWAASDPLVSRISR